MVIIAGGATTDMLIGAAVSARHGKRGWHIIPHVDHIRSIGGLVHDGVLFSTSAFRTPTSQVRQPLLTSEGAHPETHKAGACIGADAGIEINATSVKGHKTALHAAAAVGNLAQLNHVLGNMV